MEYLSNAGISPQTINLILSEVSEQDLGYLEVNEAKVTAMINYLLKVGVTVVDELLIYKTYLFYESFDTLKEVFGNPGLVAKINENVDELDNLLN